MIFLGYNFLQDGYSWLPVPTHLDNITDTILKNGIYDHFNITKDTAFNYITDLPGQWNLSTIMDADFNGNAQAGNVDYVASQVNALRIKKRKKGSFNWYTVFETEISGKSSDFNFTKYDYLGEQDTDYEYAIVPVIGNIEGGYSINSVTSQFYGIFITDQDKCYRLRENASYSGNQRIRPTAIYEPFGGKYPIVMRNGELNYEQGTVNGDISVIEMQENKDIITGEVINHIEILDRKKTVERLNAIKEFLTNDNAKILKDFNGNIWLVTINDSLPVNYYSEVGMGIAQISFNWTELGAADSAKDLYDNNLIASKD